VGKRGRWTGVADQKRPTSELTRIEHARRDPVVDDGLLDRLLTKADDLAYLPVHVRRPTRMVTRSVLPSLVTRTEHPLTTPTRPSNIGRTMSSSTTTTMTSRTARTPRPMPMPRTCTTGLKVRPLDLLDSCPMLTPLSLVRRPLAQVSSRMSRKRHSSLYGRSSMQRRRRATGPSASSLARRGDKRMLDVHGGADNAPSRPGSSFPRVHLVRGFKALKQTTKLLFCTLGRPEEALKSYEELLGYTKSAVTRNCPSPFPLPRLDLALSPV